MRGVGVSTNEAKILPHSEDKINRLYNLSSGSNGETGFK